MKNFFWKNVPHTLGKEAQWQFLISIKNANNNNSNGNKDNHEIE